MRQTSPASQVRERKTGELFQQLGLNMLVIGLIALIALLVWQRFFVQPGAATTAPSSEPGAEEIPGDQSFLTKILISYFRQFATPAFAYSAGISWPQDQCKHGDFQPAEGRRNHLVPW